MGKKYTYILAIFTLFYKNTYIIGHRTYLSVLIQTNTAIAASITNVRNLEVFQFQIRGAILENCISSYVRLLAPSCVMINAFFVY